MTFWPKSIVSNSSKEETRLKIEQGYNQAIKNEFLFSESIIETEKSKKKLYIIVKAFRFLRRGSPTKYSVQIQGDDSESLITLSSNTIFIRIICVISCIGFFYAFDPEPLFLNSYVIDCFFFLFAISFIFAENILERKKIIKAIEKTLII